MTKTTQNDCTYVKDDEQFLNGVFHLSQITNLTIVKNSKKFIGADGAIIFRDSTNLKFCRYHAIVNNYDVYDFRGYLTDGLRRYEKLKLGAFNPAYSESLRRGMLSMLPPEKAREYLIGLRQHEQAKLESYLAEIEKLLPQQE